MSAETNNTLDRLFYPRNIAMVGASPNKGKVWSSGNAYIAAAIEQNFSGNIYPVHPKASNILGFRTYSNVREIPDEIDLAIFTVPTKIALKVMEDCVAKGVKFAHLLTAGFTETGRPEHAELEKKLVHIARKGGVRIVGPNCMGLYCPEGGIAWNMGFPTKSGSIGLFSQSGQLASHFIHESYQQGLAFSKAVSFGNASDLQAHEFLEYLAQDRKTRIIVAYLEGLRDGRAFLEAAKKITGEKPLVVWKGGQTEGGSRATQSHTAAIAGSLKIWQALCRQAGIILVHSMQEAVFTVAALKSILLPRGTNVAILGGAGGGSVTMTDIAEKEGLRVPHLSEKSVKTLEGFVPLAGNSVKNPLDVFFDRDEHFMTLVELLRDDPHIDAFIYNLRIHWMYRDLGRTGILRYIHTIVRAKEELKKPMFIALEREGGLELDIVLREVGELFHENGIPTFPSLEITARVLHNLREYERYLSNSDMKGLN